MSLIITNNINWSKFIPLYNPYGKSDPLKERVFALWERLRIDFFFKDSFTLNESIIDGNIKEGEWSKGGKTKNRKEENLNK